MIVYHAAPCGVGKFYWNKLVKQVGAVNYLLTFEKIDGTNNYWPWLKILGDKKKCRASSNGKSSS